MGSISCFFIFLLLFLFLFFNLVIEKNIVELFLVPIVVQQAFFFATIFFLFLFFFFFLCLIIRKNPHNYFQCREQLNGFFSCNHLFPLLFQHLFFIRRNIVFCNLKIYDYKCCNPSLGLATKTRGLQGCRPRGMPRSRITCSRECKECKECEGMNPRTPIVGVGIPNLQSAIAGVKTHWFGEFFIPLKRY